MSCFISRMRWPFAVSIRSVQHRLGRIEPLCQSGCYEYHWLGPAVVEKLFAAQLVEDVAGIYRLTVDDLLTFEGFKEKSAEKLYEAIQASKENSAEKLLFGLGIRHVGSKVSQILLQEFHDLDQLATADPERIASIDSLSMVVAESLKIYFRTRGIQASLA